VQSRIDEFVNNARWENEEISPYGSSICDKNANVLRAALQNIRGISNNTDNIALEEIDAMDNYGIDLLGMNEVNIAMTLERRLQLATALQLRFAGSRTVSSSMKSNTTGYLPGGTTMIMLIVDESIVEAQITWVDSRGWHFEEWMALGS
jgi:hypothetical protein